MEGDGFSKGPAPVVLLSLLHPPISAQRSWREHRCFSAAPATNYRSSYSKKWIKLSWSSSTLATNGRLPFILQLEMDANDIRVARGVQFDLNLIVLSCTKPHDYLWSYRLSTGRSMKHCALTGGWWTKIWTTEQSLFTHTRKMCSLTWRGCKVSYKCD